MYVLTCFNIIVTGMFLFLLGLRVRGDVQVEDVAVLALLPQLLTRCVGCVSSFVYMVFQITPEATIDHPHATFIQSPLVRPPHPALCLDGFRMGSGQTGSSPEVPRFALMNFRLEMW